MKSLPFVSVLFFLCLSGCDMGNDNNVAKGPRVVHVPNLTWPGMKKNPEMDAVFRDLSPGEEIKLKIVFPGPKVSLVTPEVPKIERGSVWFYSKAGYFRLDSNGKVYSNPDGKNEVELDSFIQWVEINYDALWNTKSTNEMRFKKLPIKWEENNGEYTGYVTVKLSQDFKGDLTGWRSYRGK